MGILDKLLEKKKSRRNKWNHSPYFFPNPNQMFYAPNQPLYHSPDINGGFNSYQQNQIPISSSYQSAPPFLNPSFDSSIQGDRSYQMETGNWTDYSLNNPMEPQMNDYYSSHAQGIRNRPFITQTDEEQLNRRSATQENRQPYMQPFYGNPLSVDSYNEGSSFGQSYQGGGPSGSYNDPFYGNPYQPNWANNAPYPNGAIQQNPFQANLMMQQPFQANPNIKQPSSFGNILNQFKSQNGSVDVNKMMNTAGQMVSAVNQFSGIVKGIGGIFKL